MPSRSSARWPSGAGCDVLDRRGYGTSPDRAGRVDFDEDARDLAALLDEPADLVGHSYGGVVCLLAAALRPEGVRSLAVIEPPAFAVARGTPAVEEVIVRIGRHFAEGQVLSEEAFLDGFLRAWGFEQLAPRTLSPRARRGVRSSMTERMPWEAAIPLDRLAAAGLPVLVARGAWDEVERSARELAGARVRGGLRACSSMSSAARRRSSRARPTSRSSSAHRSTLAWRPSGRRQSRPERTIDATRTTPRADATRNPTSAST